MLILLSGGPRDGRVEDVNIDPDKLSAIVLSEYFRDGEYTEPRPLPPGSPAGYIAEWSQTPPAAQPPISMRFSVDGQRSELTARMDAQVPPPPVPVQDGLFAFEGVEYLVAEVRIGTRDGDVFGSQISVALLTTLG